MTDADEKRPEGESLPPPQVPIYDPLAPDEGVTAVARPAAPDDESTLGMGTVLALGCVAGTILLIIIALVILGLLSLL